MKRIKVGDIVEIKTKNGNVYAQFTHKHEQYGSLLRVFVGELNESPSFFNNIVNSEIQFSTFFPLQAAVKRSLVDIVANVPVPVSLEKFPIFRNGVVDPKTGKVAVWWLWDGKKEKRIGFITDEQRKFPLLGVWNDTLLIERIEAGWTPEMDRT